MSRRGTAWEQMCFPSSWKQETVHQVVRASGELRQTNSRRGTTSTCHLISKFHPHMCWEWRRRRGRAGRRAARGRGACCCRSCVRKRIMRQRRNTSIRRNIYCDTHESRSINPRFPRFRMRPSKVHLADFKHHNNRPNLSRSQRAGQVGTCQQQARGQLAPPSAALPSSALAAALAC